MKIADYVINRLADEGIDKMFLKHRSACTLYRLDFSSGRSYIGITVGSVNLRYRRHAATAKAGSIAAVSSAWRKYGCPILSVVAIIERSLIYEMEQKAIAKFLTLLPDGYNMTPGGEVSPTTIPEIAARAGNALRGKKRPDVAGKNNPMHRPEVRRKHAEVLRRPEIVAKLRSQLGREILPVTRLKISLAKKGWNPSADWRAKVSARMRGTKLSPETKRKVGLAGIGRKQSPETIAKRLKTFQNPAIKARLAWRRGRTFKIQPNGLQGWLF